MENINRVFYQLFSGFLIITLLGIVFEIYHFQKIESDWQKFDLVNTKKLETLKVVYRDLGYGGAIHDFKNFVLRKEKNKLESAEQEFKHSLNEIEEILKSPALSQIEVEHWQPIKSTISEYLGKAQFLKEKFNPQWSAEKIDSFVKVDDRSALQAFESLNTLYIKQRTQAKKELLSDLKTSNWTMVAGAFFSLLFALLLIFVAKGKIVLFNKKFETAHNLLAESLNEIYVFNKEDFTFKYINEGALTKLGYSEEQIMTMNMLSINPHLTQDNFNRLIKPLLDGQKTEITFESCQATRDGEEYNTLVDLQITNYEDQDCFVAMVLDTTTQVEAKKMYDESINAKIKELQALNKLLAIPRSSSIDLISKLKEGLDYIVAVPWIQLLNKGGIFLVEEDELNLVVSNNLGQKIENLCSKVKKGHCLCGRAFEQEQAIHASCIDDRHDVTFDGISPHGHYNMPIKMEGSVLGVLVLYLPHGHERNSSEIEYLEACCEILANIIDGHTKEQEILAARQSEAINAMIVTYNHELNNPLATVKTTLAMELKNNPENKRLLRAQKSLDRTIEIVRRINAMAESDKITFDDYAKKSKMIKVG